MPASFPPDRFDEIPKDLDRVGAHRAPRKRGRGWIAFGWAALATIVLIAAGAVGIMVLNNGLDFTATPGSSASSTPRGSAGPTAAPTVDPSLSVTVLNGTDTAGLAASAATALTGQGWTVGATSNASTSDIKTTTVYYADATLEGAARGVASALPGASIALSSDFADSGAQIVAVLGADYKPAA